MTEVDADRTRRIFFFAGEQTEKDESREQETGKSFHGIFCKIHQKKNPEI